LEFGDYSKEERHHHHPFVNAWGLLFTASMTPDASLVPFGAEGTACLNRLGPSVLFLLLQHLRSGAS